MSTARIPQAAAEPSPIPTAGHALDALVNVISQLEETQRQLEERFGGVLLPELLKGPMCAEGTGAEVLEEPVTCELTNSLFTQHSRLLHVNALLLNMQHRCNL